MNHADITFIGHMAVDELRLFGKEPYEAPGSAVLCGALAAARIGQNVAVITRMNRADVHLIKSMVDANVQITVIDAPLTTRMVVIHHTDNVDERDLIQTQSAGFFSLADIPDLNSDIVHLAGITDQEFNLPFIKSIKGRASVLSADMQSFVRQVDVTTGNVTFGDVAQKKEIVALLDKVKLDVVEAKILTGSDDLSVAAQEISSWGCNEVVITRADGVLARVNGVTLFEKFTNKNVSGRTGRGDTTFAAYLVWRKEHTVAESLKFASALVSIKMETPGPFNGTLQDVLDRMRKQ